MENKLVRRLLYKVIDCITGKSLTPFELAAFTNYITDILIQRDKTLAQSQI